MLNENDKQIDPITIYDEDFCNCTCTSKSFPGAKLVNHCSACNVFAEFFKWLFSKKSDKTPFF